MGTPAQVPDLSLKDTAAFLAPQKKQAKVTVDGLDQQNPAMIANVPWGRAWLWNKQSPIFQPHDVKVNRPELFDSDAATHELVHLFQASRDSSAQHWVKDPADDKYNYGGPYGLKAAGLAHKTIADFGLEQQAKIVEDYHRMTRQAIAAGNGEELQQLKDIYEPFVQQLANMPDKVPFLTAWAQKIGLIRPTMDIHSAPPVPPSNIAGAMLVPSALLGGPASMNRPDPYAAMTQQETTNKIVNALKGATDAWGQYARHTAPPPTTLPKLDERNPKPFLDALRKQYPAYAHIPDDKLLSAYQAQYGHTTQHSPHPANPSPHP